MNVRSRPFPVHCGGNQATRQSRVAYRLQWNTFNVRVGRGFFGGQIKTARPFSAVLESQPASVDSRARCAARSSPRPRKHFQLRQQKSASRQQLETCGFRPEYMAQVAITNVKPRPVQGHHPGRRKGAGRGLVATAASTVLAVAQRVPRAAQQWSCGDFRLQSPLRRGYPAIRPPIRNPRPRAFHDARLLSKWRQMQEFDRPDWFGRSP